MNQSRITITHTLALPANRRLVIQLFNTQTNQPLFPITATTTAQLSPTQIGNFFVGNANFNSADFITAIDGATFTFQSLNPNIVFMQYQVFAPLPGTSIFSTNILSGFTFSIDTVTVNPIPENPLLPQNVRTPITNSKRIKFANSPIFIRETGCESILVNVYVWSGQQTQPNVFPVARLRKDKLSPSDDYISIEISDIVKPFINPLFVYNRALPPTITSQGVFLQAQVYKFDAAGNFTENFTPTFFATLGYLWNYEQNIISTNGVSPNGSTGFLAPSNKWYNSKIHNYFQQTFNFNTTVFLATTANLINYIPVTPPAEWSRCALDPYLIVYLNKLGLWETFTPHGKVLVNSKVERVTSSVTHRDPSEIDNSFTHSKRQTNLDVTQSYQVNTGSLTEDMISQIEELIYSPKVYLIKFKGDFETVTEIGITIDSTIVTIDSTAITIDSQTIPESAVGFFKTHQQIPVIVTDEDFTRKTRLNDKINIDYNLKFEETNNKINAIR